MLRKAKSKGLVFLGGLITNGLSAMLEKLVVDFGSSANPSGTLTMAWMQFYIHIHIHIHIYWINRVIER